MLLQVKRRPAAGAACRRSRQRPAAGATPSDRRALTAEADLHEHSRWPTTTHRAVGDRRRLPTTRTGTCSHDGHLRAQARDPGAQRPALRVPLALYDRLLPGLGVGPSSSHRGPKNVEPVRYGCAAAALWGSELPCAFKSTRSLPRPCDSPGVIRPGALCSTSVKGRSRTSRASGLAATDCAAPVPLTPPPLRAAAQQRTRASLVRTANRPGGFNP